MKMSDKHFLYIIITLFFSIAMTGFANKTEAADNLLPEGLVVQDKYMAGMGTAVGEIRQTSGKVVLIHKDKNEGYWATEGLKLFKGDTIITLKQGFVGFKLNDGSFITLSSETKLVINKSVYSPKKRTRSTFMNMILGKARFVVKKLVDARHSEFKVKTKTSVAGVRGSDFIIVATGTMTEITTLKDTELEVISLAAPEATPTILHDFEKTSVKLGALPKEVHKVKAEEVDRLMKEFMFRPQKELPKPEMEESPEQKKAAVGTELSDKKIYIPMKDLTRPQIRALRAKSLKRDSWQDLFKVKSMRANEQKISNQQDTILQQKIETIKKIDLPEFPGTPQ